MWRHHRCHLRIMVGKQVAVALALFGTTLTAVQAYEYVG